MLIARFAQSTNASFSISSLKRTHMHNPQRIEALKNELKELTTTNIQNAIEKAKIEIGQHSRQYVSLQKFEGRWKDLSTREIHGLLSQAEVLVQRNRFRHDFIMWIDQLGMEDLFISRTDRVKVAQLNKSGKTIGASIAEDDRKKMHLFIESDNEFSKSLRLELLPQLELRGEVSDHFPLVKGRAVPLSTKAVLNKIRIGMRKFIKEEDSKFAFLVFPEEPNWSQEFLNWLLSSLEERDKYIVCFESGHSLKRGYYPLDFASSRILLIESDHRKSAQEIIDDLEFRFAQRHGQLHVILINGPKNSRASRIRSEIFTQYCTDKIKACLSERHHHTFRLTLLNEGTWKREKAQSMVSSFLQVVELIDSRTHTAFLCANDSVALGVIDALKVAISGDIDFLPQNYSVFGFDGVPEFKEVLFREFDIAAAEDKNHYFDLPSGATIDIPFSDFVESAISFIEGPWRIGLSRATDFKYDTETLSPYMIKDKL